MLSSPQSNALFIHASLGIVVVNGLSMIEAANPFALNLFGYSVEELMGQPIEILIPSKYQSNHVNHREAYVLDPTSRPMGVGKDLFAVKKDGAEFPIEISLGAFEDNGQRNVIVFLSDITVRKKAEAEIVRFNDELEVKVERRTLDLKEAMHQLEISKDKLEDVLSYQNALLDNAGAMIMATDELGQIRLFNPEAEKNLGYKATELINKSSIVLFNDRDELERKRVELFNKYGLTIVDDFGLLVENSRKNIHEEEFYNYIRKDLSSFPVSLTITAITDKQGHISGYMVIAIDISERRRAEQNLQEALEKEKELSELKSRFVSMASHEFRTPLSTILSSAYLIEKYKAGEDQPKRDKHLQRIVSSVNMLTDILNDFLSVGKIEEGKIQVRLKYFNISQVIVSIIEEIKNNLKKEQQIKYNHQGHEEVHMDASLLKHIVMNLISNAAKFSSEGGIIEINTICTNEEVKLSVADTGIGISKEDQKHLMERFFRAANASNIQGTGLGLHIVSKYAELMNGQLIFKSELEKGSEFTVLFNRNAN